MPRQQGRAHPGEHERAGPTTSLWLRDRCLSPPHSLAAGNRADPEVIRVRDLDLPYTGCNIQESRLTSHLGNTVELALVAWAQVS